MAAALTLEGREQAVRRFPGRARPELPGREGHDLRLPRPERGGQDLDHPHDPGPAAGDARGGSTILGADDGRKVRDRIGFLPEERGLYKKMTPVDAIAFFGSLKGLPMGEGRKRAPRDAGSAGARRARSNKKMKELSKGMAQKVQLIASVVHRPEFVILDEPFSGLDPVNQQGLEAVIRGLAADGATVLFSTHVMQHAERLCDKVVLLARGQKAFEGTVTEARATSRRFLELEGAIDAAQAAALPGVSGVEIVSEQRRRPRAEGGAGRRAARARRR